MIDQVARGVSKTYSIEGKDCAFLTSGQIDGGGGWYFTDTLERVPVFYATVLDSLRDDEAGEPRVMHEGEPAVDSYLADLTDEDGVVHEDLNPRSGPEEVGFKPRESQLDYDDPEEPIGYENDLDVVIFYPGGWPDIDDEKSADNTDNPLRIAA
ncbi:MAG: hypothetical protein JXC85_02705 [Candidatus Aenigmarchaeota archaeon]|nr:hypothetical protein [Candidatus Aenigmarchaeota archaeon]